MTTLVLACSLALALSARSQGPINDGDDGNAGHERVHYDYLDKYGELTGGFVVLEVDVARDAGVVLPAPFETIHPGSSFSGGVAGNVVNRVDLVFVGDGYLASELSQYDGHVDQMVVDYFDIEPLKTYTTYYNVHRVDVVSNESGVDNDPVDGIMRDTALNMGFWCGGVERLLCVSVGQAYAFANNAPDVDLVAAIANSTKYGGAGYVSSDLATTSGGNNSLSEILIHEFGHALGNLADEYDYGGPTVYAGPEPNARNVSIHDAATMQGLGTKWADWLGVQLPPFDGTVGTFEGANHSEVGIFRPSNNSAMRNLGRQFNAPGAESIIIEIYKVVSAIDDSSPIAASYTGAETLFVIPMSPVGHSLDIQWELDGSPIAGATGTTLDLSTLVLCGVHDVSVTVVDPTSMVIDEAARAQFMTDTRTFQVQASGNVPAGTDYCFGDGGDQAGCTDCACANNAPPGTVGGCMNGSGSSARLSGYCIASLANDTLRFELELANPLTFAVLVAGDNALPNAGACAPGSGLASPLLDGLRCVGGNLFRHGTRALNAQGTNTFPWGPPAGPSEGLLAQGGYSVGQTRRFQAFYRENDALGCGTGQNTSNGVTVTTVP